MVGRNQALVLYGSQRLLNFLLVLAGDGASFLQNGQSLRTRRWAMETRMAEGMMPGLTPSSAKTGECAGGVIGVQCREDQVAGQGGIDGDVGGVAVADLTDHDDVRVLTHGRAQAFDESVALVVDLGLDDAGQMIFDRVFERDDLHAGIVDALQERVQASWSCRSRSGRW